MGRASKGCRVAGVVLVVMFLVGAVGVGTTSAQSDVVSVSFETSYDGTSGDGSQAVEVTATFTANGEISGFRVNFIEVDAAFIDFDSFRTTSGPNVNVEPVDGSDGRFRVESLSADQEFTVSFAAYPKRLDESRLRVAAYRMSAENPQTFSDEGFVTADLSDSPYIAVQDLSILGEVGLAGFVAAVVLGVAGLATGAYIRFLALPNALDDLKSTFVEQLGDVRDDMVQPADERRVEQLRETYRGSTVVDSRESGSGATGTGGGSATTEPSGGDDDTSGSDGFH